jgi:hypothetical protein
LLDDKDDLEIWNISREIDTEEVSVKIIHKEKCHDTIEEINDIVEVNEENHTGIV